MSLLPPEKGVSTLIRTTKLVVILCSLSLCFSLPGRANEPLLPLPDQAFSQSIDASGNPIKSQADQAIDVLNSSFSPQIPNAFTVDNSNGLVSYDSSTQSITYSIDKSPLRVHTSNGQEIIARGMIAHLPEKKAELIGPLTVYHADTLTHAESGFYDWEEEYACVTKIRSKVNGILIRGSKAEYLKDDEGKSYMMIHNAFISSEDVETPSMWVGTGSLEIHPGDYGVISRLSVAGSSSDMRVPVVGWFPISHSLNPREGYLPIPGAKSIWGGYLLNRYGILFGNRRVENGIPVADYVATCLLDYRARRGVAGGVELTDEKMRKLYKDMEGIALYGLFDRHPSINRVRAKRVPIHHGRYRIAAQTMWSLDRLSELFPSKTPWSLTTDINIVSDRYMLQDFFEDEARLNDKPDNTVRLARVSPRSQTMLFTRFAPNNYYDTDERAEFSYYRARTVLGKTRIAYETRNSASIMHQTVPADLRMDYKARIARYRDQERREYYTRLLNTSAYSRVNSTHELSTELKILRFLNVTPKVGGGYSGYYGVEGVGADNRFLGYLGCDFDIKFYRHFSHVRIPSLGINGLYHIFHPYAEVSHGSVSSSNALVPQVDTWSSTLGNSTVNPMPMDIMQFTGIDGWTNWTIWRLGLRNTISTVYDNESRTLINWNLFLDYNVDNPNTSSRFSNLFSLVEITLNQQCSITFESQTPTIRDGDGFNQYNTSVRVVPLPWLELYLGQRYISNHPIQGDANYSYFQTNLRVNERYTLSARVNWDAESNRIPIQQYSLSRKFGPWYVGATLMFRNNGGKKETGFGMSFTLGETGTSLPVDFF